MTPVPWGTKACPECGRAIPPNLIVSRPFSYQCECGELLDEQEPKNADQESYKRRQIAERARRRIGDPDAKGQTPAGKDSHRIGKDE
jgi:hypothetical protein